MPTSKPPAANTATKPKPALERDARVLAVPRTWLVAFAVLMIAPWLVAGGLYNWRVPAPAPGLITVGGPQSTTDPGPWGQLKITPIVISPPIEYVAGDWGRTSSNDWRFPETSPPVLDAFLAASGLSQDDAARLRAKARPDPDIRGLTLSPDLDIVRRLDPQVRARLYLELAKSPLNFDQANSFRFFGDTPAAWLDGSQISTATRRIVEPLIYRDGEFLHFSDVAAVRSQIHDEIELRRLAKTLLRQSTALATLAIPDLSKVAGLTEYWGRGGRRTDIRPLLESVAAGGPDRSIDIVHLLPSFARDHLYRYPKLSAADLDKPLLANCLWTALNFFNSRPDDRFLTVDVALNTLRSDYYVVEGDFLLGDIVAFVDAEGDLFHAAVYIADDFVFSKNGTSPMAPWTLMPIERVKAYYRARSTTPRLIYHRRNDL